MNTQAFIIFTAALAAIAGIGSLLFWLGLFTSETPPPIQTSPKAEEPPDIIKRLRIRYENADLSLSFDGFILISTAVSTAIIVLSAFLNLFFYFLVIAFFTPVLIYQFLVTSREDRINQKREQLIYFIRDYADTLRVFKNPQQTNLELVSRANISSNNFFYELLKEVNQAVVQGTPFNEAMLGIRDRFNSPIWKQFIQLVVGTTERGVPIADALKALASHAERQFRLLNRINVQRKSENADANIMLIVSLLTIAFVSRTEFVSQYANSPIFTIAQIVAASINILAWFGVRWAGQLGIHADTAKRYTFSKERTAKFRQFQIEEEFITPRFVLEEQK